MTVDGVNIIGPVFGELGLGEDVRTLAEALVSSGVPTTIFNYPKRLTTRQGDRSCEQYVSDSLKYSCNIFCFPAFELMHFFLEFGPEPFEGRYNIGYWPWELSLWPKDFSFIQDLVDEIWASSAFTLNCFQNSFSKPVFHIPLIIKEPLQFEALPTSIEALEADSFKFLFVFDANSTLIRKNPKGLLRAFASAFGRSQETCLILKTMNYRHHDEELSEMIAAAPNVIFINESFSKAQINLLFKLSDAYVSLHRSEGFGRTMAEAMLLGKSVVTSDYSGNVDYCNENTSFLVEGKLVDVAPYAYPFWRDAKWFDPSHASAVSALKTCSEHPGLRQEKIEAAYKFVSEQFSTATVAEKALSRIAAL
ncbi:glycosyltransferase [Pseudanabaena sp. FACHB-2040]|uniref:glycosyltransferase n=1 Tax=Pseudanabaena sp. FACHB-2040 TaxID=2692859 RepID=UPI0016849F66|nr:glycosyltransferase [Pseudanabaena sp. FACHB-2040]MBD2257274.1 glycosyltransferase [Pseudanabaena sp. FACHB-2040]